MAYRTGAIQSGDKLLAIDNFRLEGCSVEDAAHILQSASSVVQLRLQKEEVPTIAEGNRRKPLFMFGNFTCDWHLAEAPADDEVVYTVELQRKSGPLGITISGTEEASDHIFISALAEGGLAQK